MRSLGYVVREIWKCEFDRLKEVDLEVKYFLKKHPAFDLDLREAFLGNRTENTVILYDVKKGEKI